MRPAWSVIWFTVLSGAGFGAAGWLAFLGAALPKSALWFAGSMAALFVAAGLFASTAHLANPKNAWRALFRLRSSWLSREAALAVLFFPLFAAWMLFAAQGWRGEKILAGFVVVVSLATVFCTAMIYAALKTVRLWRHVTTPINYIALSWYSGGFFIVALCADVLGGVDPGLALALASVTITALPYKVWHFLRVEGAPANAQSAVGLRAANVRLLETGHTAPNFLTREFVYVPNPRAVRLAKIIAIVCGFLLPLAACPAAVFFGQAALWLALPFLFGGLLAERWLFFAEARHSLQVYYGGNKI